MIAGGGLSIEHLDIAYDRHVALSDISCRLPAGTLTAVAGPNGAGKSTMLKAIAGLLRPAAGHIRLAPPNAAIAFLPQQSEIDRTFPMTVADTVLFGRWRSLGWHRAATNADLDQVVAALDTVGLSALAGRGIGTLSAGQFQRMLFARLIVQDAPVILLDEPFNALDQRTVADLLALIRRWHDEGRTVVAVLHDLAQIAAHFPETILLARTLIAAGPTATVLTQANLAAARAAAERWDADALEIAR